MDKINIVIADDHKLFRKGLRSLLESFPRINDIREASDGVQAMKLVREFSPHAVLMDLRMPVKDGIQTSELIIRHYPDIKVLILTMYDDDKFIRYLMDLGVHGYLLKNAEPSEVEKAIYSVVDKDFYYNQKVVDVLRKTKESADRPSFENFVKLTSRESEVLRLLCKELSNKEIADQLSISVRTVEKIRSNLLGKVKARNTVGLVKYAIEHELSL